MSSLINSTQISSYTGVFSRHFDTFSTGNYLIIHKEPLKSFVATTGQNYFGYGDPSNLDNIVYTPVSGVYPFIRVYDKNNKVIQGIDIQKKFGSSKVRIKVEEDARNFIKNGKNEKIEFDGLVFNEIGEEDVQNFLGKKYYYFSLTSTN